MQSFLKPTPGKLAMLAEPHFISSGTTAWELSILNQTHWETFPI